jgi:cytidine deaminase
MPAEPTSPPFLSAADLRARAAERKLPREELVVELLPWAASFARAPISNFRVGALVLGRSGVLYAGANLEFPGAALSFSVHAEQAAVYNAWLNGEAGVMMLASSAAPCGYCRQFLNELANASELRVLTPGHSPTVLGELLPASFGPRDLGVDGGLMQPSHRPLKLAEPQPDPLTSAALGAAASAYAPYSGTYAGVGLRTATGAVFEGRYAENAAFNPSLSPLQGALIALALAGGDFAAIEAATLVEASEPPPGRPAYGASQRSVVEALLAAVAPRVSLTYLRAAFAEPAATVQAPHGLDSTDTSALS